MVVVVLAVASIMLASGAAIQADTITHGSTTINMAFVNVDNAGNPADPATGSHYGAVGYDYRIGTYDVTAAQWATVMAADPNVGNAYYWSGSQPAAGMTWNQAAEFCNWLTTGNALNGYYSISSGVATPNALSHDAYAAIYGTTYFLPTENEWYKAAFYSGSGSTYYNYATGSNSVPTAVYSGTAAGTAVFKGNDVSPTAPADVDQAGGLSPYGTMGQDGNVQQWNETLIAGSYRGKRGGGFAFSGSGSNSPYLAASFRSYVNPTEVSDNLGFRVASSEAVPEPGTITLVVCGGLCLLAYGWRRRGRTT
jgi:formylglycine-generating enzyme required for sulfatase activity